MFKALIYTSLALLAFAGNSVLCRLALSAIEQNQQHIDAASFTHIRLLSGIIILIFLLLFSIKKNKRQTNTKRCKGSWQAAICLFIYAITFSYGYISLDTGTGALILFGAVQLTMVLTSIYAGDRLQPVQLIGLLIAFSGFIYLVIPTFSTPSFSAFILMSLAGVAWAFYTLLGKQSTQPLADTTYNFIRTLPLIVISVTLTLHDVFLSFYGVILAILSGAITSGVGYFLWYLALRYISPLQAGVLQLLVPIIAAVGGVLFAQEIISLRLSISSLLVLGGVFLVLKAKPVR